MKKRCYLTSTLLLAALCGTMAQMQSSGTATTVEKLPSAVFDLTNWKLNIPVADANGYSKEIVQPDLNDYSDDNFHVNASGDAVVFRAHANGATTKGSSYPRSELREMQNNGNDKACWSIASGGGTHTMQITQAVTHLPTQKRHVVVGQIHDADDDVIVFRLENKKLFIDHNGKDGPVLTSDYQLGTKFTVKFVAGGGAVRCYYNGMFVESYPSTATGCYFKAGMYTQSKPTEKGGREDAEDAEAYGEAEVYQLTVTPHRRYAYRSCPPSSPSPRIFRHVQSARHTLAPVSARHRHSKRTQSVESPPESLTLVLVKFVGNYPLALVPLQLRLVSAAFEEKVNSVI